MGYLGGFDFLNRGSILQALVASQSKVMSKDLNEELLNLGLLWSDMEFPDTEQLSSRLSTCPAPQGVGLHFSAWSWQTFSLLWVLPRAYLFEGEVTSNTYNLCCLLILGVESGFRAPY